MSCPLAVRSSAGFSRIAPALILACPRVQVSNVCVAVAVLLSLCATGAFAAMTSGTAYLGALSEWERRARRPSALPRRQLERCGKRRTGLYTTV